MTALNTELSQALVEMADYDRAVRAELVQAGTLSSQGYHPRMAQVHQRNADNLAGIINQYGWPGMRLVGEEGAWAAWLIAQHAISNPAFMRQCLVLLQQAAANSDIMPWQAAMLEDRIRMFEGKPQRFGIQFEPNNKGELMPYPIENPETVDERRLAVGLNSLAARTAELRAQAASENVPPPSEADITQYEQWLYRVGWRIAVDSPH